MISIVSSARGLLCVWKRGTDVFVPDRLDTREGYNRDPGVCVSVYVLGIGRQAGSGLLGQHAQPCLTSDEAVGENLAGLMTGP